MLGTGRGPVVGQPAIDRPVPRLAVLTLSAAVRPVPHAPRQWSRAGALARRVRGTSSTSTRAQRLAPRSTPLVLLGAQEADYVVSAAILRRP